MPQVGPQSRHSFVHEGRTIYEWDQTLRRVQDAATDAPVAACTRF